MPEDTLQVSGKRANEVISDAANRPWRHVTKPSHDGGL